MVIFPASGPMKISDNNIENIFNINIYINGVFSNDIQSDIVNVLVQLLNQQSTTVGGMSGQTLKDQLMDFVKKAESNDVNLDIPASSLMTPAQQSANLDGLAKKIQEALSTSANTETSSNLDTKAKDLSDLLQQLK